MERSKVMMVVAAMALAIALVVMVPGADATRYTVGSNMGWTSNVNYTIWALDKHFYNGDWLFFVYDRNKMNVLEVNKTDYETCNSDHPLHNWTTGAGRDVVPLNVTRYYYFISGKGFCHKGMKLAVLVEDYPLPSPTASPLKEKSGSRLSPSPSPYIYRGQLVSPTVSPIVAPPDVGKNSPPLPPTASPLNEKSSDSPSSIYKGQLVSSAVLLSIAALWDSLVRVW